MAISDGGGFGERTLCGAIRHIQIGKRHARLLLPAVGVALPATLYAGMLRERTLCGAIRHIRIGKRHARLLLPAVGVALLATPYARMLLEQSMLTHVLVQLPLLTLAGALAGVRLARGPAGNRPVTIPYHHALPLLTWCLTIAMIWMLPRLLDASLEHPAFTAFKFVSLPLLLGLPLPYAWRSVGQITRAFFIANLLSMGGVLAWLYIASPVRLCYYYLIAEQKLLGIALLCIVGTVALYWTVRLVAGPREAREPAHSPSGA